MYRAMASGIKPHGVMINSIQLHSAMKYEKVHPQQCGYLRRKVRTQRRPTMPRENPFVFYPKLVIESVVKYTAIGLYAFNVNRLRKRIQRDPASKAYTDLALTPVNESLAHRSLVLHRPRADAGQRVGGRGP